MHLEITDTRTLTDAEPDVRGMEFHNTPVSIGSHSASTLQLPDTDIAPYHAMLLPMGNDQWAFQPTDADGQTLVNGHPAHGKVVLEDGDVLTITYFTISFTVDVAPDLVLPKPGNVDELAKITQYPLPSRSEVRKVGVDVSLSASRQQTLAAFALRLRGCFDLAQLIEQTIAILLDELGAWRVWMGVRRNCLGELEIVDGRSSQGKAATEPSKLDTYVYRCLSRHQFISIPRTGDGKTQSVLAIPILAGRGAYGLIYADTKRHKRVFDHADFDFITMVAGMISVQVEALIGDRLEHEAQLASTQQTLLREIQARLDVQNVPHWPGLQAAVFAKPGSERAGDVYDLMRLPNGLAALMIGHIEAEPIRVAMCMAEVRSAFRVAGLHADPPRILLRTLNWLVFDETDPCRMDVSLLVMNPKTGACEYATAGETELLVINPQGEPRSLKIKDAPAIGTTKTYEYGGANERILPGATVALYTNGCTTVCNEAGEALGLERFVEALCDGFGQSASATLDDLQADLGPFFKNGSLPDDITIMLLHRAQGT